MKNYSSPRIILSGFTKFGIVDVKICFLDVKVKETKKKVKFYDNTKLMVLDKASKIFFFDFSQNLKVINNLKDFF